MGMNTPERKDYISGVIVEMDTDELKLVLEFARDRGADRARQAIDQFNAVALDYCATSNLVRLLVDTTENRS